MFYSFSLYIKVGTSLAAPEETQETWIPSLVGEDPLKEEMATHSSILAWENFMDRGAWQATVHGVEKETMTE